MARAYASAIIEAPVEVVWAAIRDFGALASWHPALAQSAIEGGGDPDVVGCIRSLALQGGGTARERLLMLDDSRYSFAYNFESPAFPIDNYVATVELIPVTNGDKTFAQWTGTFDPRPEETGDYVEVISNAVFAAGWAALAERLQGSAAPAEQGPRWQGLRPAKVFCSSIIPAPAAQVWSIVRDFASMDQWHPDIADMSMKGDVSPAKISGVRRFRAGQVALEEQLTFLSDPERSFRYRIVKSEFPWLNYHAGLRLHDVTAGSACCAVWSADWTAAPLDDLQLIPFVHHDVFQRAFDTLTTRLSAG